MEHEDLPPLSDMSEAAERRALLERDAEAIVRGYWRVPQILASRWGKGIAWLERDDLVQEARIGLAKAVRDYNGHGVFAAFAWMCAERNVSSAIKSATRRKHSPLVGTIDISTLPAVFDAAIPVDRSPEQVLIDRERVFAIIDAVRNHLTPLEQAAIVRLPPGGATRLDGTGQTYADVADELGVGKKQFDNARQRATRKLSAVAAAA